MCVWERGKSWNIKPNETNSSLEILIKRKQKVVLKHWTKRNKKSLFLNLFLSLMWLKSISIIFIKCATWQDLILSCMRSLLLYMCVYIYIYIDWFGFNGKVIDKRNRSCLFHGKTMSWERKKMIDYRECMMWKPKKKKNIYCDKEMMWLNWSVITINTML